MGTRVDTSSSEPVDHCVCGSIHHVPIETVVIDESAVEQLVAYAERRHWSQPFVIMDANTAEAAGSRVIGAMSKATLRVGTLCFPERDGLIPDETSVSRVLTALEESGSDSIVAVGSGVITDLTRFVASRMGREFVSVPTAASVDGYASSVAAMEFGGMKATFPAQTPVAIFAEPRTLAAAPPDMTRAGIGDLLGKASARVDWLASHSLYGERFCAEADRRVAEPLIDVATNVGPILQGSPEAVAGLLQGLVESGIAMAMVGNSRPASGCEHHASHFWDLLAANGRRTHTSHGLQVGYATHFAMRLQAYAFDGGIHQLLPPRRDLPAGDDARSWFTGHGAEVDAVMDDKRRFLSEHAAAWPSTASQWESVRKRVGEAMRVFPLVDEALLAAAIPATPGFLGLDAKTIKATFRWANRMRSRYTVLDFLEGQGGLAEAIDAVLPLDPPASN